MILLLVFSIIAASFNSILLHKVSDKTDVISLNMVVALVWIVVLFAANGFTLVITRTAIIWGVLYGVLQMLFLLFKARAMGSGPVSITTLIGNCSLIITTAIGVLVWNETISWVQILGMALLIIAFFCCTYVKASSSFSKAWILNCIFLVVFSAAVGISFKAFSKSSSGSGANDMMIIAAIVMFVVLLGIKIALRMFSKNTVSRFSGALNYPDLNTKVVGAVIIIGLLSCTYNRLNMSLAGYFPSVYFYPSFNGGVNLLSLALGTVLLKEQLTTQKIIGITLGTIAVVIIGIF